MDSIGRKFYSPIDDITFFEKASKVGISGEIKAFRALNKPVVKVIFNGLAEIHELCEHTSSADC